MPRGWPTSVAAKTSSVPTTHLVEVPPQLLLTSKLFFVGLPLGIHGPSPVDALHLSHRTVADVPIDRAYVSTFHRCGVLNFFSLISCYSSMPSAKRAVCICCDQQSTAVTNFIHLKVTTTSRRVWNKASPMVRIEATNHLTLLLIHQGRQRGASALADIEESLIPELQQLLTTPNLLLVKRDQLRRE